MKGKRILVIVGSVTVLLVVFIVALGLYLIHTVEQERNKLKMRPANDKRWAAKEDPQQQQQQPEQKGFSDEKPAVEVPPGGDQGGGS